MGVNHSTKGTETVNAINNLALITGNIGRAGAAPFSITGQCNAMGTREAGFASSLPGYRKFESADDREELAALWNVAGRADSRRRAASPIPTSSRRRSTSGSARSGSSPPIRSSRSRISACCTQALEGLDFLVVQDGFHPTPTSELAHLVLPAAIWGEKEGTYTNSERRVSKVNRAVRPAGRGALRLRHLPRPGRRARRARRAVPGLDDAARCLRRVEARLGGPPLRLLGHDLRGDRAARRHPVAVSRRRDRPGADAAALRPTARSRPTTAGAADPGGVGAVSRAAERRASRSCSTPAAPSSTGTRAPRPARCRSSSGCRRTRGSR